MDQTLNNLGKGITFLTIHDMASYALRLLSGILKREGYLCRQIYFKKLYATTFPYTVWETQLLIKLLRELNTKLLCVSLRSSSLKTFAALRLLIKEILPHIDILMGGIHPTLAPDEALHYSDAICIGDGEETIVEIARNYTGDIKSLAGIKGVQVKLDSGEVLDGGSRGIFENLDSLPIEVYEDADKYYIENNRVERKDPVVENSTVEIFASRGCPRQCTYCSNSVLSKRICLEGQKFVRLNSVGRTISNLLYLKKRFKNIKKFVFADEAFGLSKEWVDEFCEVYPEAIKLPFSAFFCIPQVDEHRIYALKKAGLSHVRVGIQSGSEHVRTNLYKRNESNEQILAAARLFHKLGIRYTCDLIVNNPYESEVDKLNTLKLLTKLPRSFELNLHSLVYFPGTVLTRRALSEKIIKPEDVEGRNSERGLFLTDVLSIFEGNDVFWNSLFSLCSKNFIPRSLNTWLAGSSYFRRKEIIVLYLAKCTTFIKLVQIGIHLLMRGEISLRDTWKTVKSIVEKPLTNK